MYINTWVLVIGAAAITWWNFKVLMHASRLSKVNEGLRNYIDSKHREENEMNAGYEQKVCPECGHQFQGNGWDGIDAHWRSKHEQVMPYEEAWPLMRDGTYTTPRPTNNQ